LEIKRPHRRPPILTRHARAWFLTVALSVLGTLLLVGMLGLAYLKHSAPHRYVAFQRLPGQVPEAIGAYFRSLGVSTPEMQLSISHPNLQQLDFMRQRALKQGIRDFSYVPGEIWWQGDPYPVRLRLKGDRPIHYQYSRQWSFRVAVKEGKTLLGMRRFSLHLAGARNYAYEWMFHRFLATEGLLHLQYHFLDLHINGESMGLYALEEHFGKELVERQGYREGPLLAFDESWHGSDLLRAQVLPYEEERWTINTKAQATLDRAVSLLEGFRQGSLRVNQVFDPEELATYFALCDLLGMSHGAVWKSPVFYYDPLADCLRPVGMDGHFQEKGPTAAADFLIGTVPRNPAAGWYYHEYQTWFALFFPDSMGAGSLWVPYIRQLHRLSQPAYLDSVLNAHQPALDHQLRQIEGQLFSGADHLSWYGPDLFRYDEPALKARANWIQLRLHGQSPRLFAHQVSLETNRLELRVGNFEIMPLEVLGIGAGDTFWLEKQALLPAHHRSQQTVSPRYQTVEVALPPGLASPLDTSELRLAYRLPGLTDTLWVPVRPWRPHLFDEPSALKQTSPQLDRLPFLQIDHDRQQVHLKPGSWQLSEPLLLPEGYALEAGPGTEIDLQAGALIRVKGPLRWRGTPDAPIRLYSSDGNGQGIAVIGAKAPSSLEHVQVEGLQAPDNQGWRLTGALTFYQTEVNINHLWLKDMLSENALNLVRCTAELRHTWVQDAASDAIDLDFSQVNIFDLHLTDSGNDGLNLSGGRTSLKRAQIRSAGDKGISIGEGAVVTLEQVVWEGNRIGLAVKDLSQVVVRDSRFAAGAIGVAVYQKKPEYGPGSGQLWEIKWENMQQQILVEAQSSLNLEGKPVEPQEPPGLAERLGARGD